jgi:hypothetical protein
MSYSADDTEGFHQATLYVGRARSLADLPATKFRLAINLKTANALGVEVPRRKTGHVLTGWLGEH